MSKYVFKNPEVEKALRLVAKQLGYTDEEFDEKVRTWIDFRSIMLSGDDREQLQFPSSLLKREVVFSPNDWNSSDIEPPEDPNGKGCSLTMLIENDDGYPSKGFFVFLTKTWIELGTGDHLECSRYRLYPSD